VKKQLANITVLSSLILGINTASADAPTAELKVIGSLTVPGCAVIAPDSGVYDFGRVSASVVQPSFATTALSAITKTWTVSCDADTHLNFTPVDNRTASVSVPGPTNFGMGNVNGAGKIGHYTARIHNATVDGVASDISYPSGQYTGVGRSFDLKHGIYHAWQSLNGGQSVGKVFTADITVSPILAGATTMGGPINDDVNLDGSMTMNFRFSI
jgi:Protein of unknown function (DUF1120)